MPTEEARRIHMLAAKRERARVLRKRRATPRKRIAVKIGGGRTRERVRLIQYPYAAQLYPQPRSESSEKPSVPGTAVRVHNTYE
jgi:hypothetical protein